MNPASSRLVTQSLIISALRATTKSSGVTWREITDLAALIDVCCLFEEAHVLGRSVNVHLQQPQSAMYELVTPLVRTDYVTSDTASRVRAAAKAHLRTMLDRSTASLPASTSTGAQQSELESVDTDDFWGSEWTMASSEEPEPSRSPFDLNVFLVRTFLYLGYADVTGSSLTTDYLRSRVVAEVLTPEHDLVTILQQTLGKAYATDTAGGFQPVRERVSPIAAVVFQRASKNHTSVAQETYRLRDELSGLRASLRTAEYELYYASHADAHRAAAVWESAIEELRRAYSGEPDILTVRKFLTFTPELAGLADESLKYVSWTKMLLALPLEAIRRLLARRTVVDLHNLRPNVPAGGALSLAIADIFGEIAG